MTWICLLLEEKEEKVTGLLLKSRSPTLSVIPLLNRLVTNAKYSILRTITNESQKAGWLDPLGLCNFDCFFQTSDLNLHCPRVL